MFTKLKLTIVSCNLNSSLNAFLLIHFDFKFVIHQLAFSLNSFEHFLEFMFFWPK